MWEQAATKLGRTHAAVSRLSTVPSEGTYSLQRSEEFVGVESLSENLRYAWMTANLSGQVIFDGFTELSSRPYEDRNIRGLNAGT